MNYCKLSFFNIDTTSYIIYALKSIHNNFDLKIDNKSMYIQCLHRNFFLEGGGELN